MEIPFSVLVGKTFTKIEIDKNYSKSILFTCSDGSEYSMYHAQDCCEQVRLEEVIGDVEDLLNTPICIAEGTCNAKNECNSENGLLYVGYDDGAEDDFYTWTFYTLRTQKGTVVLRWKGDNGESDCYSAVVMLEEVSEEGPPMMYIGDTKKGERRELALNDNGWKVDQIFQQGEKYRRCIHWFKNEISAKNFAEKLEDKNDVIIFGKDEDVVVFQ